LSGYAAPTRHSSLIGRYVMESAVVRKLISSAGAAGSRFRRRMGACDTVANRVAQEVARRHLEPILEPLFHADSYGSLRLKWYFNFSILCDDALLT
jgi:hypothetical protein